MKKLNFLIFLILTLVFFSLPPTVGNIEAQLPAGCTNTGVPRAEGLVSSRALQGDFGTSADVCVVGTDALYVNYKIQTYDQLKATFYEASRSVLKSIPSASTSLTGLPYSSDNLSNFTGDISINPGSSPTGSGVQVIFIDGNLFINTNIAYPSAAQQGGLVFVVKGNVNIEQTVTDIDAVIISEGVICTASQGGVCPAGGFIMVPTPLTVNGSLIALSKDVSKVIQFKRTLNDNTQAAEIVNNQAKYMVILKDLFSQTLTINSEDTDYSSAASMQNMKVCGWYVDNDRDGFGAGVQLPIPLINDPGGLTSCASAPATDSGYSQNNSDCNDTNAAIKPGAGCT